MGCLQQPFETHYLGVSLTGRLEPEFLVAGIFWFLLCMVPRTCATLILFWPGAIGGILCTTAFAYLRGLRRRVCSRWQSGCSLGAAGCAPAGGCSPAARLFVAWALVREGPASVPTVVVPFVWLQASLSAVQLPAGATVGNLSLTTKDLI